MTTLTRNHCERNLVSGVFLCAALLFGSAALPAQAPARIALLRLDTDWYESTYHELVHLFPRLSVGGVLLIDDYGHWQGARRAVDQSRTYGHFPQSCFVKNCE